MLANNCTACVNILTIEISWLIVWAAAAAAEECEWVLRMKWLSAFKKQSVEDVHCPICRRKVRAADIILPARVQRPSSISLFADAIKVNETKQIYERRSNNSTLTLWIWFTAFNNPSLKKGINETMEMFTLPFKKRDTVWCVMCAIKNIMISFLLIHRKTCMIKPSHQSDVRTSHTYFKNTKLYNISLFLSDRSIQFG